MSNSIGIRRRTERPGIASHIGLIFYEISLSKLDPGGLPRAHRGCVACERINAVRRRGTNHLPKHRDIQKLRCGKGLQARAAIERDAPNPSESWNQPCYLACPGCSRNGELPRRAGCLGADKTERKGSRHGEGNKDHDDEGSRLQVGGRPRGGAVGTRRPGSGCAYSRAGTSRGSCTGGATAG